MSGSIRKMPIMAMRSKQAYELEQKAIEYLRWAQKQNWDGVASAFASGAAEGMVSASESALDGSTLGAYSWLDNKYDFGKARRQQEVQQLAESANLGTAYQIANTAAEVGGGMRGAAVKAWDLGAAAAKAIPLINKSKIIAPAIGGAGLSSLTENSFKYDFSDLQKIGLGTLQGTAAAVALVALQSHSWDVLKKFFPEANLAGIKGGIDNVVQSEKAAETVQKGMAANPELAQDVADQLPRAIERINKNTADTVNQALKQRIDVPQTVANRQAQFDNYLKQHAADEVLDFAPRQQLDAILPTKSFDVEKELSGEQAKELLKKLVEENNINIYGDINHFTKGSRAKYVKTLSGTLDEPNVIYTQTHPKGDEQTYFIKKFIDENTGKEFYDFIIERDGKLFDKYNTDQNYILNQFNKPTKNLAFNGEYTKQPEAPDALNGAYYNTKKPIKDLSFHRRPSEASELRINLIPTNDTSLIQSNIYANGAVVNNNLKNIFDIYKTLSFNQQKLLHEAFNNVLNNSTAKAGSFENLQSAIRELDKMAAVRSQNGINPAEAADMLNLQNLLSMHLGELYRQKALKLAKVKPLEEAYKAGLQTKPLPQTTPKLEQTAYAQGKFNNMTANNAQNNLAKQVLQEPDINKQIYNKIHLWLQQQNEAYQRSKLLEQQAQRWMLNEQKPRNYIEQIRYYLETDAGRKALNRNFDGTNKWYSRQPEPYFINSMVQNYDK